MTEPKLPHPVIAWERPRGLAASFADEVRALMTENEELMRQVVSNQRRIKALRASLTYGTLTYDGELVWS